MGAILVLSGTAVADNGNGNPHGAAKHQHDRNTGQASSDSSPEGSLMDQQSQFAEMRAAPGLTVSGQALLEAVQQANGLSVTGGAWTEVTTQPYNAEPSGYTDPAWSNAGAGFSLVGGRATSLARTSDGAWYVDAAGGGVWKSVDKGAHWVPVFESMPTQSIGALAVNPVDGSLWVGTGEANVSVDTYQGTGVYRSADGGASFQVVGPDASGMSPLVSRTTYRIAFDPSGNAYAATGNGLFRYAAATGKWTEVLDPAGPVDNPPYDQQVTDVAVVPGSGGGDVITAIGWHGPGNTQFNGFYESTDGGLTFHIVTPTGDIDPTDIGRTTFQYSADGAKLYAIVQSLNGLAGTGPSVLQGIFVSSGTPASVTGHWRKIADQTKLANSGSASPTFGVPGQQAWYNEDLAVDPNNHNHVYAGLEEVYESKNGGTTWVTASPYWNFGLACGTTCPQTTHPDQHAMMVADGKIVIGNDGGVYSRPLSDKQQYGDWSDLNATLRTWQYYDGRAGGAGTSFGVWGGLQDNGDSLLAAGAAQMIEPAGGDGFDVIVDPANANRFAGEYVNGTMYSTTDGGHNFKPTVSPTCVAQSLIIGSTRADCDPGARFWTPLIQDQQDANTWVIGGKYVWVSHAGWNTSCDLSSCSSWTREFNTGSGNAVTALTSANGGAIVYAAWTHSGNPGATFGRGIVTNYGGTWHQLNTSTLPNRFIQGVTVDASNAAHAYAIFGGYSRKFIPSGGVGHVFETTDGGVTWTDISGNLPDVASDALVLHNGKLVLGTDAGAFIADAGGSSSKTWSRFGSALPAVVIDNLTVGSDGLLYAATHGRGIWRIALP